MSVESRFSTLHGEMSGITLIPFDCSSTDEFLY